VDEEQRDVMKPIIAVTTYGRYEKDLANPWYKLHFSLPALYVDAVRRAGGVPLLLPPGETDVAAVLATVDGLLVTGGVDIHPAQYGGDSQHPQLTHFDTERDALELALVQEVIGNGRPLPTLCICRGMQVLNVALGGTLHEHVADLHPHDIHRGDDGGWTVQEVNIIPTSLLAEVMQATTVATYSGHHQAVKGLGTGLRVVATAVDGITEAVEHPDMPWLLGVQWHPEITAADDATQQQLFDELVQAAARYKGQR
jgi:putative glutamine amidotransferase